VKIAIVTYDEYINIPYIKKYEKIIVNNGDSYDVILWDRRGCTKTHPRNHYVFNAQVKKSKLSKIVPFLKWRQFALKILKNNQYDKLIVLTTIPAILICDYLNIDYTKKFFFDIRDYTYERFWPYKKLVNWIVEKSAVTSISSKAFMQFLSPSANIVVTHNISNDEAIKKNVQSVTDKTPITIGFIGGIRYYEENCRLLMKLKHSPRFRLRYVGKVHPGCDLSAFATKNAITNVDFFPAYNNDLKPEIYKAIDLINAIYGRKTQEVLLGLPNKLYDCVVFKKPIIVSKGTYLSEIVEQYHLGISIDIEKDDIEKSLTNYLCVFNSQLFEAGCKEFLKLAQEEEMNTTQRIIAFLKEKE
jgi:hypothetical protein